MIILREFDRPMHSTEILMVLRSLFPGPKPYPSRTWLLATLSKMYREGKLKKLARGVYALP